MGKEHGLVLALLLVNAAVDFRKKKISLWTVVIYGLLWLLLCMSDCDWDRVLIGCIPGIVLMTVSYIVKGAIGMGDGILVLVMGLCLSWMEIMIMLTMALGLAFCWALIQLVLHKNGKRSFPFVPFLLMGYCVELII